MTDFSAYYASRALTVAAELDGVDEDDNVKKLRTTLALIDGDIDGKNHERLHPHMVDGAVAKNEIFRPAELPDTHFMRFVIVNDHWPKEQKRRPGPRLPLMLVWECNHDGDAEPYLRRVQKRATETTRLQFDRVFQACKGYPKIAAGERWIAWMLDHSIEASAFYCGYRGVRKNAVDAAGRVRAALRTFLDEQGGREQLTGKTPAEAHQIIRAHLATLPEPMVAGDTEAEPDPRPVFHERERRLLRLAKQLKWIAIALFFITIPLAAVLAVLALPIVGLLWLHERLEKPYSYERAVHATPDLIAVEDRIVQNQLTHIVDIKPGLFRYVLQHVVLWAIDLLARIHYVDGHLGNITSIHFGRWVILKDRRWWRLWWRRDRLIFFSNYDFSWDSYLGEFVDRQATGLTAVWSNTIGFPRTRCLIEDGATDEERFKQWARDHQIPSQVWWSGVRDWSVANVIDDLDVHRGAAAATLAEEDLQRWLRRL